MGIVKKQLAGIKVLGNGELTKKVTVKASKFSAVAKEKIEKWVEKQRRFNMFANLKQIFNPKNKDILKRILYTFAALFVFKIGTTITVPGVNLDTSNLKFLEIVNAMSGEHLKMHLSLH